MNQSWVDAGLGRRYLALMVDWILSGFIAGLIEPGDMGRKLALQMGIFFIEKSLLTYLQRASIGQWFLSLRVIDRTSGQSLSLGRAALRTVLVLLVLPALFTSQGKRVHDLLTRSSVVRVAG